MTNAPAASDRRTDLAAYYRSRLRLAQDVQLLTFLFARTRSTRGAISAFRARLPMSDGSSLWFSGSLGCPLDGGEDHLHEFIGTFDAEDLGLTELTAAAAHYDREIARLDYGHTFPLDANAALRERGLEAALVLEAGIDPLFRGSSPPESLRTTLFFIAPLTGRELALKRADGLPALFEEWQARHRVPFSIPQAQPRA